ncbi:glycoside hydrolase family 43 protein, partial [Cerasicoccus arenae]
GTCLHLAQILFMNQKLINQNSRPSDADTRLVLSGMHPDPTVCRVGDHYYLATSSFGFFPGIPLYVSEDLINWRFLRHILSRPEQLPLAADQPVIGRGIFAPTLRHDGERFYLVTTNFLQGGNFIVSATDPAGEWSAPVWIEDAYQGGIDPSITFLDDGRVLYQVTWDESRGDQLGITQFEIDLATGKGLSPRQHLSEGCGWKAVEGPHLFNKGQYWYLLLAEGGTEAGHRVTISRSETPWGPWTSCPHNPILCHSGIQSPIQNTGHADLFEGKDGQWWIVFLGVRPLGHPPVHITGRETFIASVEWSDEGWPIVNNGKPITLAAETDADLKDGSTLWSDEFSSDELHHRWVTLNAAYRSIYSTCGDGKLTLHAKSASLSEKTIHAFVGTRLDGHNRCYETRLSRLAPGAKAGIAVFMETFGYYSLGIQEEDGAARATFTRRVLDMETTQTVPLEKQDEYPLRVALNRSSMFWSYSYAEFVFSIETQEGVWTEIGRGTSRLLGSEVIGGFTGLLVGMYCLRNDPQASASADFRCFTATSLEKEGVS